MIRTQGTLIVKKISSRNGPFPVADLVTDVAEFKVKDSLLDQFEEGEYHGTFFISEIFLAPYVAFGRCVTELRARLHDIRIDSQDRLKKGEPEPEEPDPIDEAPAPRAKTKQQDTAKCSPAARPAPSTRASKGRADDTDARESADSVDTQEDEALFGAEIFQAISEGSEVRLDPTIDDRARFRAQTTRLRALGFCFNSKRQVWQPA